jgi:hypothetical protein
VCSPGELDALDAAIDEQTWVIGRLVDGDGTVSLRESP